MGPTDLPRTKFVWADGRESWHATVDSPYYPRWTVEVDEGHDTLPPGRHEFVLMTDGTICYYKEVDGGQEDEEATG